MYVNKSNSQLTSCNSFMMPIRRLEILLIRIIGGLASYLTSTDGLRSVPWPRVEGQSFPSALRYQRLTLRLMLRFL